MSEQRALLRYRGRNFVESTRIGMVSCAAAAKIIHNFLEASMKSFKILALAAALVVSYALSAVAAPVCSKKIESFDFVVDYSGSMMMTDAKIKKDKILVAKDVLTRINALIPALDYQGGLHTIAPTGTLVQQGPWDRANMAKAIGKLTSNHNIFGRMTAMGNGLKTYEPFISSMKRKAAVILVTDGDNNRGVDLVSTVQSIYASQRDLVFHIISFADTPNGKATIEKLAKLNPNTICVSGSDLAVNEAALQKFVLDVWCEQGEDVIVLRGVNFAFNSYALDSKAMSILNEAANIIKSSPGKRVLLNGYTDWIGSDAYNMKLSQNRAEAVKDYLAKQGIPSSRMTAIGRGKSYKYDNKTEEGRYMNRRVEISFE